MLETIWGLIVLISVIWVIYDVATQNKGLTNIMKVVWILAALIFGILGAIAYYFLGKNK
ncbi:PLDc N-terminal domain-containing protein [Methanolobus mangrovi]|uniref:PLDc N-terminal domain-containing protein n=1 Tax=Methanolobus mangrovi TaxID=3072977 RepID=A0AA51YHD4_9EURY|nr:PLDc N-terminal domain-containing protein [Methanolobus mangrovi]WMW23042.1 PLDc N-terminal domain-containing protein [Methanolobus mangrovi]